MSLSILSHMLSGLVLSFILRRSSEAFYIRKFIKMKSDFVSFFILDLIPEDKSICHTNSSL